jgi:hypothetical protein
MIMHALVVALTFGAVLGHFERNPTEAERLASELIELSTRQNFVRWLPGGEVLRGWARSALGDTAEGVSLLENRRLKPYILRIAPLRLLRQ